MSTFYQALGVVFLGVILTLALGKQGKEMALLLSLAACILVGLLAFQYLEPVVEFLEQLGSVGNLHSSVIETLLKAVGIGLIAEIGAHICADSGNGALGKMLQILASAVILWLALPLLTALLELLEQILGGI